MNLDPDPLQVDGEEDTRWMFRREEEMYRELARNRSRDMILLCFAGLAIIAIAALVLGGRTA